MSAKKSRPVLKVPYKSGWILVSHNSLKIKAHAKNFSDIVVKSEKFDHQKHFIMTAADSYQNQLMVIQKTRAGK